MNTVIGFSVVQTIVIDAGSECFYGWDIMVLIRKMESLMSVAAQSSHQ